MDTKQQDGRISLFTAAGALFAYLLLLSITVLDAGSKAFGSAFGLLSPTVALLFPLLSFFGCVAGLVYGTASRNTLLGKSGIVLSLVVIVLLALFFRH